MRTKMVITPDYTSPSGGYQISIGTGKTYHAKDHGEIQQAVAHYFRGSGTWCAHPRVCPFCRVRK